MRRRRVVTRVLLQAILAEYALPWTGTHGVAHWARVLENGRRLAARTGADPAVVELFAVFHDSKRVNEIRDPGHGKRGAAYAAELRGVLFELPDAAFAQLQYACAHHTDGLTEADVTVQACWDADRLDLGRCGITPMPRYLCTAVAKEPVMLAWAEQRSTTGFVPPLVFDEWGLELAF